MPPCSQHLTIVRDDNRCPQSVKSSTYETDDSGALLVCLFGVNQYTCAYNLLRKRGSGMPSWSHSLSSVRDANRCPQPVKASTYETADSVAPLVEKKCCLLESKCKIQYDLLHYLERIKTLMHRNYRGRRSALCHLEVSREPVWEMPVYAHSPSIHLHTKLQPALDHL